MSCRISLVNSNACQQKNFYPIRSNALLNVSSREWPGFYKDDQIELRVMSVGGDYNMWQLLAVCNNNNP